MTAVAMTNKKIVTPKDMPYFMPNFIFFKRNFSHITQSPLPTNRLIVLEMHFLEDERTR